MTKKEHLIDVNLFKKGQVLWIWYSRFTSYRKNINNFTLPPLLPPKNVGNEFTACSSNKIKPTLFMMPFVNATEIASWFCLTIYRQSTIDDSTAKNKIPVDAVTLMLVPRPFLIKHLSTHFPEWQDMFDKQHSGRN